MASRSGARPARIFCRRMASRRGFEPPTPGLGNRCSIRVSYRDVARALAKWVKSVRLFRSSLDHGDQRTTLRPVMPSRPISPISIGIFFAGDDGGEVRLGAGRAEAEPDR